MFLYLPSLMPARVTSIIGEEQSKRIDGDPVLSKKVKGTGVTIRELIEPVADACAASPRVQNSVDKVGSWLACVDEVLGRAADLFSKGVPITDSQFSLEVDGTGVTLRDVASKLYEVCRRNTARVLEDPEEDARRCASEVATVARLRLKELFS